MRAFRVKAEIPYPLFSKVEFELNQKKYRICGKEFGEKVSLSLLAEPEEKAALEVLLQDLSGGKISLTVEGDTFVQARKDI